MAHLLTDIVNDLVDGLRQKGVTEAEFYPDGEIKRLVLSAMPVVPRDTLVPPRDDVQRLRYPQEEDGDEAEATAWERDMYSPLGGISGLSR